MMISPVNSIAFKQNATHHDTELTPDEKTSRAVVGTMATGGAITASVSRGRRALEAVKGITNKTKLIATSMPKNTKTFKNAFLRLFEGASNYKILKPLAKLVHCKLFRGVAGVIGGLSAFGVAATSIANTINTGSKVLDKYS